MSKANPKPIRTRTLRKKKRDDASKRASKSHAKLHDKKYQEKHPIFKNPFIDMINTAEKVKVEKTINWHKIKSWHNMLLVNGKKCIVYVYSTNWCSVQRMPTEEEKEAGVKKFSKKMPLKFLQYELV